ncbi:T-lymphocyte surface antigen Ly-9-like isoform X2 [Dendropsophus ebraccatus]|uniref:T-lymphocyte surface antigen Ly-9-like isoform X2 n=1 Tax=Dendropsophus ebraccatus TaxID=150705 RepID=UPI003831AB75
MGEKLYMCLFILLYHRDDVSSESPCGERRNVTGEMGGAVTLYTDYTGIRDITWVRDHNAIAVTQPGDVADIINSSYRGRLSATRDGSLVITNLTREDQGYYMANILRASQCIQEYYLTVYDKNYTDDTKGSGETYNVTANDTTCSHNSFSEIRDCHQHLIAKILPAAIVPVIIVSAILIIGYWKKRHPQCTSNRAENTPRKADNGAVWKTNDIYNI